MFTLVELAMFILVVRAFHVAHVFAAEQNAVNIQDSLDFALVVIAFARVFILRVEAVQADAVMDLPKIAGEIFDLLVRF